MSRDIADLEPTTWQLACRFMDACKAAGLDIVVTYTLRTFAEQDALYAQGRTVPGRIVTQAQAGQSPHNYGMAFDVVPIEHGRAVWDSESPLWGQIGAIGKAAGLDWGGDWPENIRDRPHLQRRSWKDFIGAQNVQQTA